MMLGCSSSLEENQFSSLAGLTDALQTNPHQIKTCMVTEYWQIHNIKSFPIFERSIFSTNLTDIIQLKVGLQSRIGVSGTNVPTSYMQIVVWTPEWTWTTITFAVLVNTALAFCIERCIVRLQPHVPLFTKSSSHLNSKTKFFNHC